MGPGPAFSGASQGDLRLPALPVPCFLSLSFLFPFDFPCALFFGFFSFCCSCSYVCISALRPCPQTPLWAAHSSVLSHGVRLCPGTPPCPQATCQGFPCFSCLLGAPPSGQNMAPTPTMLHTSCPGEHPRPPPGLLAPEPGGHFPRPPPPASPALGVSAWPRACRGLGSCSPGPSLRPEPAGCSSRGSVIDGDSCVGSLSGPPRPRVCSTHRTPWCCRLPPSLFSCCGVFPFPVSPRGPWP